MSTHDPSQTNAHGAPGTIREVRKTVEGRRWPDLPLLGWAAHLPAGWAFIPAAQRTAAVTPRLHATFVSCLPVWAGFQTIESREIVVDNIRARTAEEAARIAFAAPTNSASAATRQPSSTSPPSALSNFHAAHLPGNG